MNDNFQYQTEQFSDIKILRYKVPGFENLSLSDKVLIYHLSEAAKCGRDILFDQNNKENLYIRRSLEAIYLSFSGDRSDMRFESFVVYLKRVWFSSGIHHHYSMDKFYPQINVDYFEFLIDNSKTELLPLKKDETKLLFKERLSSLIFDKQINIKRVSLDSSEDIIKNSANNYYENISQNEVEDFYNKADKGDAERPISVGLNSKLIKKDEIIYEKTYKMGGMYSKAIHEIVLHLTKASEFCETEIQKDSIIKLIEFYKTGDLNTFDQYSILWVKDLDSRVDMVNGFIEVYGDALAIKGSWEALVNFKNIEATKRTEIISDNAQWFEDNSPVDSRFKKKTVKGVSAKVITVAMLGGDCYPTTPIGVNLPNAEWIRKEHGSKSVTIDNITDAYHKASLKQGGMLEEFAFSDEEISRAKKHSKLGGDLHTDLHECLGHGSGQLLDGVGMDALKNYHSTLEEARADLFALYYIYDQKLVDLSLIPSLEVGKSEYDSYIRNGLLTQLVRIEKGKDIEESHMRNRQLVAKWAFEKGSKNNVIEKIIKDNKTYFVINDYSKLRDIFGDLLAEIQRIKSEGDLVAGAKLVEDYAVKIDDIIHVEVLERFSKLNLAAYSGFINPEYTLIYENNDIVDVKIEFPDDFTKQMLYYSDKYSFLDNVN